MKLSQKKIKRITDILVKLTSYAIDKRGFDSDSDLIKKALQAIVQAVEGTGNRSLPEHHKYWAMCKGIASHFPEIFLRVYNLKEVNKDYVHSLFKQAFEISSIAFDSMKQNEFHEYHIKCRTWGSIYILNCTEQDLDDIINEYIDDKDIK